MDVLLILGSRNHRGQTARAVEACLEGIGEAGARGELVFLPEMRLERCRQCGENGWGTCLPESRCQVEDDFGPLVERLEKATAVVFATPVYFGDLSESLKAFLDRLRRVSFHGQSTVGIKGRPALGICVAGGGGGGSPSCAAILEGTLRTCGFAVTDLIPVRRQNLEAKLAGLREAGRHLVETARKEG